tara:strand:+ start:697 stop:1359 length:663 start_codon:yes stop_codon:yes gene_type:complete
MYLNYFIFVIALLILIYVSCIIENKSIVYFLGILLIFLVLNKCVESKKEYFDVNRSIELLKRTSNQSREISKLENEVSDLGSELTDLVEVVKKQNLIANIDKNNESSEFSIEQSQKNQDDDLDRLDKELDILIKLYKKETEDLTQPDSLPVYSSCKVKKEGEMYMRPDKEMSTHDMIKTLENQEMMKNLGITSPSSQGLYNSMNNGKEISDMMDININLI